MALNHFSFSIPNVMQYSDRDPLTGASNVVRGVGIQITIVGDIASYRSMTCCTCQQSATIYCAVYCTVGDASLNLYLSQPAACTTTTKRREQNLFVRSGINLKRNLRSTFCTIEANYWQTWSIARPLCDNRATCSMRYGDLTIFKIIMGSLKSPHRTSYRSSIETIDINCLFF